MAHPEETRSHRSERRCILPPLQLLSLSDTRLAVRRQVTRGREARRDRQEEVVGRYSLVFVSE